MRSWRTWTIVTVVIFIAFNIYYWKAYVCTDPNGCSFKAIDNSNKENSSPQETNPLDHPIEPDTIIPPHQQISPEVEIEASLTDFITSNPQPLSEPNTHYPDTHDKSNQDLDSIAPTSNKATYRLAKDGLKYATYGELWQVGIINSKPDVFLVSNGNYPDVNNHYYREHRIYSLMKWILRVHRRDAKRKVPLVMVDAGSNHGLFSLVAGASGAHTIAFEPQTHLRSVINMASRINQLSERIRVLPFAVLDQFKKLAMEKVEINDGGIGGLSYDKTDALITTQTIRLDALPAYSRVFSSRDKTLVEPERDLGSDYASGIESGKLPESLTFRQPIHFLKIDVEGFELPALKSASGLFERGLVENTVLEFGPPMRWDVTVPGHLPLSEVRAKTMAEAKEVLHRVVNEWGLEIKLLPADGWKKTIQFMLDHGVDESGGDPKKKKVVRQLKAHKIDNLPLDQDEFETELELKNNLVTEFIYLPPHLIDAYLEKSQDIGEMYLWFTKKGSNSPVLKNVI